MRVSFDNSVFRRRVFPLPYLPLVLLVVAGLASSNHHAAASPQGSQPWNILVLLSDDHCYRALGCAGNAVLKTPNLDRLAAEGVYFSHCFTPMPQCSPSRAAILTGQDSWTNGVRSGTTPFENDAVLWPQLLDRAGYQTFYTGKWHNVGMPWNYGFNCGANIYAGGMSDHRRVPLVQWGQSKQDRRVGEGFSTTVFADSVIDFLRGRNPQRPFCAFVSFTAPHDPWVSPGEYGTMYDPAEAPPPPNFMPRPPFRVPAEFASLRDQRVLPYPRSEKDVRRATALYYGLVSHLDHEIGRVLTALDELGLVEETLVLFAGDHGYSLGSHGFVGKQTMYEEGIRLPLILRHPQLSKSGARREALVSLIDFFPTICEAAGIEAPPAVEGASLLPLYEGRPVPWRDRIFASHHSPRKHGMSTHCVRTERYKLIAHRLTGEWELFDLKDDPYELVNLIDEPELAAVRAELEADLKCWAASHRREPIHASSDE